MTSSNNNLVLSEGARTASTGHRFAAALERVSAPAELVLSQGARTVPVEPVSAPGNADSRSDRIIKSVRNAFSSFVSSIEEYANRRLVHREPKILSVEQDKPATPPPSPRSEVGSAAARFARVLQLEVAPGRPRAISAPAVLESGLQKQEAVGPVVTGSVPQPKRCIVDSTFACFKKLGEQLKTNYSEYVEHSRREEANQRAAAAFSKVGKEIRAVALKNFSVFVPQSLNLDECFKSLDPVFEKTLNVKEFSQRFGVFTVQEGPGTPQQEAERVLQNNLKKAAQARYLPHVVRLVAREVNVNQEASFETIVQPLVDAGFVEKENILKSGEEVSALLAGIQSLSHNDKAAKVAARVARGEHLAAIKTTLLNEKEIDEEARAENAKRFTDLEKDIEAAQATTSEAATRIQAAFRGFRIRKSMEADAEPAKTAAAKATAEYAARQAELTNPYVGGEG